MAPESDVDPVIRVRQDKFRLLTIENLLALPPPVWLIKPLIEVGALGAVYGPSGDGKTFLLLDWALSVALGRNWVGHEVKAGPTLYVIGEGGRNMRKRVAAWMHDRSVERISDGHFILESVQLLTQDDLELLLTRIRTLPAPPALIIFDTLARCFVEGDENAARDMNRLVEASRRIQSETGATVIFAHHTGKNAKDIERGSNALRGGCDVMFLQRKDTQGDITLKNTKQKDHEEHRVISLRLKTISLGVEEGSSDHVTSCVLEPSQTSPLLQQALAGGVSHALRVLMGLPNATASSNAWRKAVEASSTTGIPERTFQNWRKHLLKDGLVEEVPDGKHTYRVTESGRERVDRIRDVAAGSNASRLSGSICTR